MTTNKLSAALQQYVDNERPSFVNIIVELKQNLTYPSSKLTRQARIDNMKSSFIKELKAINNVLKNRGGTVLDSAWINKTIKLKIPVQGLNELANIESVEKIELHVPRHLKTD